MKEVAIGIDIGGTNTKIGAVSRSGESLYETSIHTADYPDAKEFVNFLQKKIRQIVDDISKDTEIKGIGIGAPNGNYYSGTIENAMNLKWKGIVPLVDFFRPYFPEIPIVLTNDANAAAIGEMIYGGAKGMKNFLVLTLGTGLGSGIVVNGDVVYGHDGFAGELGHTVVKYNGRQCACGLQGCLETYVSATGLKRTYLKMLAHFPFKGELSSKAPDEITAKEISTAALNGDKAALEAFDYTGKLLGQAIAQAAAYFSPEAVFLFGGMAKAGDLIFKPTEKYKEQYMLSIFRNKIKLLHSSVDGSNAAVLGSSALVWKELEDPRKKIQQSAS